MNVKTLLLKQKVTEAGKVTGEAEMERAFCFEGHSETPGMRTSLLFHDSLTKGRSIFTFSWQAT